MRGTLTQTLLKASTVLLKRRDQSKLAIGQVFRPDASLSLSSVTLKHCTNATFTLSRGKLSRLIDDRPSVHRFFFLSQPLAISERVKPLGHPSKSIDVSACIAPGSAYAYARKKCSDKHETIKLGKCDAYVKTCKLWFPPRARGSSATVSSEKRFVPCSGVHPRLRSWLGIFYVESIKKIVSLSYCLNKTKKNSCNLAELNLFQPLDSFVHSWTKDQIFSVNQQRAGFSVSILKRFATSSG